MKSLTNSGDSNDPNDNPVVSKPSLLRPSITIQGNRQVRPSTLQWVNLFCIPSNPVEALLVFLQWLWASYFSLLWFLGTNIVVQIALGVTWSFLLLGWVVLTTKDEVVKTDGLLVLLSILLGAVIAL